MAARSTADHADQRRGSGAFERAIIRICHQRKGIAAALDDRATAIPMVGGSRLDEPPTTKTRAKKRVMARHPPQGLNVGDHTKQETHDALWLGARGSNIGPEMAMPGGAPLCHSCYGTAGLDVQYEPTKKLICQRTRRATTMSRLPFRKLSARRIQICLVQFYKSRS